MRKRPNDFDGVAISRQVTALSQLISAKDFRATARSCFGNGCHEKANVDIELKQLQAEFASLNSAQPNSQLLAQNLPMVITFALMALYLVGGGAWTINILRSSKAWSLPAALSENGLPSTSRLIAFLGSQITLAVLAGAGCYAIWSLFTKNTLPPLSPLLAFAAAGMTLFTPYLANPLRAGLGDTLTGGPVPPVGVLAGLGLPAPQPLGLPVPGAGTLLSIALLTPLSIPAATPQTVNISGTGFQPGMTAVLVTPAGTPDGTVAPPQLVSATQ